MAKSRANDDSAPGERGTLSLKKALGSRSAEKGSDEFTRFMSEIVGILRTIRNEAEGDSTLKQITNAIVAQLNRLRSLKGGAVDPENPHAAEEVVDRLVDLVERADSALHRNQNPHQVRQITPGRFIFQTGAGTAVRFNAWSFDAEEEIFSDSLFKNAVPIDSDSTSLETKFFKVERRSEVDTESYVVFPLRGFCGAVMIYTEGEFTQVNFNCMHNDHLESDELSGARLSITTDPAKVKQELARSAPPPVRPVAQGNKAA